MDYLLVVARLKLSFWAFSHLFPSQTEKGRKHVKKSNTSSEELTLIQVQIKNILTLCQLSLFIWETTLGHRRIPDWSTEPYSQTNGEQTRHARGPVGFTHLLVTLIPILMNNNSNRKQDIHNFLTPVFVTGVNQCCSFFHDCIFKIDYCEKINLFKYSNVKDFNHVWHLTKKLNFKPRTCSKQTGLHELILLLKI